MQIYNINELSNFFYNLSCNPYQGLGLCCRSHTVLESGATTTNYNTWPNPKRGSAEPREYLSRQRQSRGRHRLRR